MKKVYLIIILCFLQVPNFLYGQDSLIGRVSKESNKDSIKFSEAVAYKMLYENQVKSNDGILKTIFYALAGLATAIILVIGGNWWFNTKKVEDLAKGIDSKIDNSKEAALAEVKERLSILSSEKTNEINQIQVKLQEEVTANITNLTSKFSDFSDKIREEIRDENRLLIIQFDERLKNYSENLLMQIKSIEILTNERSEIINQKITSLQADFIKEIADTKTDFDNRETTISREIQKTEKSLQASIYRNAGYMWEVRKIYVNALMFFAMEGGIHVEHKNNTMIDLSLDNIIDLLEKHITTKIDEFTYDKLLYLVNNAPAEQIEKINRIKNILTNLQK